MKRVYILMAILAIAGITACEQEFEIIDTDGDNRLHIEFLPSTLREWHELKITGARSINNSIGDIETPSDIRIRITADGEEVRLEQDNTSSKAYMAFHHLEPGQTVRIEAEADGFEKAYAESIIPYPVEEFNAALVKGDDYSDEIRVTVDYPDNPDTKDMYGAVIVSEETHSMLTYISHNAVDIEMIYGILDESPFRTMWLRGRRIAYWNDSQASQDGRQQMTLSFQGKKNDPNCTYRYKVLMLKISEDFYRYFNGQWDRENNILASMGLASPTFTYTNITGGLGVLGTLSHTESEWFDNPL